MTYVPMCVVIATSISAKLYGVFGLFITEESAHRWAHDNNLNPNEYTVSLLNPVGDFYGVKPEHFTRVSNDT